MANFEKPDKPLSELQSDVRALLVAAPSSLVAPSGPLRAHFAPFLAMPLRTPRQRRAAAHLFAVLTGLPPAPLAPPPAAASATGGGRVRRPLGVLF
jgi:hypothetical protein